MHVILVLIIYSSISYCEAVNKYSAEANKQKDDSNHVLTSLRELDRPFRMAKLNLLWTKAKHVNKN